MKSLRLFWDFLFGAMLIGGAPICAMSATILLADLVQRLSHTLISERASLIVVIGSLVVAALACAYAIRFRLRRRLLPKPVILGEAILGWIGALLIYTFYGLVTYSSIG